MNPSLLSSSIAPGSRDREWTANVLLPVECLKYVYETFVCAVRFTFTIPRAVSDVRAYVSTEIRIFCRTNTRRKDIYSYLVEYVMEQIQSGTASFPLYVYAGEHTYYHYYNQISYNFEKAGLCTDCQQVCNKLVQTPRFGTPRNCVFENYREKAVLALFDYLQTKNTVSAFAIHRYLKNCTSFDLRELLRQMQRERKVWDKESFIEAVSLSGCVGGSVLRSVVR